MRAAPTTFEMRFPIPRTHCGMPMGNGNFGVLVWGKERLHITVNRADFWDHRGGERLMPPTTYRQLVEAAASGDNDKVEAQYARQAPAPGAWKPQRVPVGRFELTPRDGLRLDRATLNYETGVVSVQTESGEGIALSLARNEPVLVLQDPDRVITEVTARPSWAFEKSREWLARYAFTEPTIIREAGRHGWVQACPADPSLAAVCQQTDEGLVIVLALGDTDAAAREAAYHVADQTAATGAGQYREANEAWWSAFWRDVPVLRLPDAFLQQFFQHALYRFACATAPESSMPCGLQGPWVEEYQRAQWSADYHFNVNIQQIYTLAFSISKLDHLMPLFDMLESESFMGNMRHNAQVLFGIDDGLLLTHAVDDRGFQCGWISTGSTLDHACGGWTAQLYWLHYLHSGDVIFLRERAFPFMCGIMRVYEEMLESHDGRLSIPLAISAEYGNGKTRNGLRAGRDPSYQLACIHMLLDALLEACAILDKDPKSIWLDMKKKVPPYSVVGHNGDARIAIWEGQDLDVCHRHHSHLACIYPFDTVGKQPTDETSRIIHNSIDHWISKGMGEWSEWCIPWAAIIQARLGLREAPAVLLNMWKDVFINEGLATVYLPRFRGITAHRRADMEKPRENHEIMQLDGTMAGATAILEMLVHSHAGVTRVFPAVPEKWTDISFRDIRLPGPFLISATKERGVVRHVRVRSLGRGELTLDVPGVNAMVLVRDGRKEACALPVCMTLHAGEEVALVQEKA